MSTQAQPAAQAKAVEARRRFAALSDDLALKIFVAVATTVVLGKLGFDPTTALLGAALSPVLAELVKSAVERKGLKRRHLLLATLLLFLVHGVERAFAAARRRARPPGRPLPAAVDVTRPLLLASGVLASTLTVALFTGVEAAGGHSLVADRQLTFFGGDDAHAPDVLPPELRLPADLVIDAYGPRRVWFAVAAVDAREGEVDPDCAPGPGARFPIGTTTVHCSAVDGAGNQTVGAFTVTLVRQDQNVSIRMRFPQRVEAEATGPEGAVARFVVTATGREARSVPVTCSPASGALFGIGRTRVTCHADAGDEAVNRSFAVVVVDTTAPRLTLPGDVRGRTAGSVGRVDYRASAFDLVDGRIAPTCSPSGFRFGLGTTLVSCSAKDAHGNVARGSFTVTVVRSEDTTAPKLHLPGDRLVDATSAAGAVATYEVVAIDDSDEQPSVTCSPESGALFPIGRTLVRCSARDGAGNGVSGSFTVTVADRTGPRVDPPADVTAEARSAAGARARYGEAKAVDAVDGAVRATCSPSSGSMFGVGETTVKCSAVDSSGNRGEAAFRVIVNDTTPPVLKIGDQTRYIESGSGAYVTFPPAIDAVDGEIAPDCRPKSGSFFPARKKTTVSCTATDRSGNTSSPVTFAVWVEYIPD